MILYQKSRTPYIIRTFFSGWTILGLVFTAAVVVIAYFAVQAPWPRTFGIWLLAAFVALIPFAIFRGMLKTKVKKIVLIEIITNALKVHEMKYDEVEETIIPAQDLQIDIFAHVRRDSSGSVLLKTNLSYRLEIRGKDIEKPPFVIYDSKQVLAEMLEKIEESKIVQLKLNEKDFLNGYRNPGRLGAFLNFRKVFIIAVIILAIGIGVKNLFFSDNWLLDTIISGNWFIDTKKVWTGTWKVVSPERDTIASLTLKIDSTFLFRSFNHDWNGRYIFIESNSPDESDKLELSTSDTTLPFIPGFISSDQLYLNRNSDNKEFGLHRSASQDYSFNKFTWLKIVMSQSYLMPITNGDKVELLRSFIPSCPIDRLNFYLFNTQNQLICSMNGPSGLSFAVFDIASQSLIDYKSIDMQEGCKLSHTNPNQEAPYKIYIVSTCGGMASYINTVVIDYEGQISVENY